MDPETDSSATGEKQQRLRLSMTLPDGRQRSVDLESALIVGRREGDVVIPEDPYLSGRHVSVRVELGRVVVEDLDSTNGVFVRVRGQIELRPGDEVVIGGQIFRFYS